MAVLDPDGPGPIPAALYLTGGFTIVNGLTAPGWARWDGQTLSAVPNGLLAARGPMRSFDDGTGPALYVASTNTTPAVLFRFDWTTWSQIPSPPGWYIEEPLVFDPDGSGPVPMSLHVAIGGPGPSTIYRYNAQGWTPISDAFWGVGELRWYDPGGAGPLVPSIHRILTWESCPSPCSSGAYIDRLDGNGLWQRIGTMEANTIGLSVLASVIHDDNGPGAPGPRLIIGGTLLPSSFGAARAAAWNGTWTGLPDSPGSRIHKLASYDPDGAPGPANPVLVASTRDSAYEPQERLVALQGSAWTSMGNFAGSVSVMRGDFDPDGASGPLAPSLVVSGNMGVVGGQLAGNFATLQGSRWRHVVPSPSGPIYALEVFNDGSGQRLFAGGTFVWMGTTLANNVARWDGAAWQPLGDGVRSSNGQPASVRAAAMHNDGSGWALYVGGRFDYAGFAASANTARWTGQQWETLGAIGLTGGEVNAMISHDPDGTGPSPAELYAGGTFLAAVGVPAQGLARWDGAQWRPVVGFERGEIRSFRSFDDGEGRALFMAGSGIRVGGLLENRAAKLASMGWVTLPPLGSAGTVVNTLAIHVHGAGYRVHALGDDLAAVLYPGGWFMLPPPPSEVFAARSFQNSQGHALFAGRWRLTQRGWDSVGEIDGPVYAMSPLFDDGHGPSMFMGGNFARADWRPSPQIVRLRPCARDCYANCDQSFWLPVLNVSDFTCFLQRFAAVAPYANCDQSTAAPVLNVADFACFLQRFAAGCE